MGKQKKPALNQKQKQSAYFSNDDDVYECDRIVDVKLIDGRRFYLIKWKDFSQKYNTWEPLMNLDNILKDILEFQCQHALQVKKMEEDWKRNYSEGKCISPLVPLDTKRLMRKIQRIKMELQKEQESQPSYEQTNIKYKQIQKKKNNQPIKNKSNQSATKIQEKNKFSASVANGKLKKNWKLNVQCKGSKYKPSKQQIKQSVENSDKNSYLQSEQYVSKSINQSSEQKIINHSSTPSMALCKWAKQQKNTSSELTKQINQPKDICKIINNSNSFKSKTQNQQNQSKQNHILTIKNQSSSSWSSSSKQSQQNQGSKTTKFPFKVIKEQIIANGQNTNFKQAERLNHQFNNILPSKEGQVHIVNANKLAHGIDPKQDCHDFKYASTIYDGKLNLNHCSNSPVQRSIRKYIHRPHRKWKDSKSDSQSQSAQLLNIEPPLIVKNEINRNNPIIQLEEQEKQSSVFKTPQIQKIRFSVQKQNQNSFYKVFISNNKEQPSNGSDCEQKLNQQCQLQEDEAQSSQIRQSSLIHNLQNCFFQNNNVEFGFSENNQYSKILELQQNGMIEQRQDGRQNKNIQQKQCIDKFHENKRQSNASNSRSNNQDDEHNLESNNQLQEKFIQRKQSQLHKSQYSNSKEQINLQQIQNKDSFSQNQSGDHHQNKKWSQLNNNFKNVSNVLNIFVTPNISKCQIDLSSEAQGEQQNKTKQLSQNQHKISHQKEQPSFLQSPQLSQSREQQMNNSSKIHLQQQIGSEKSIKSCDYYSTPKNKKIRKNYKLSAIVDQTNRKHGFRYIQERPNKKTEIKKQNNEKRPSFSYLISNIISPHQLSTGYYPFLYNILNSFKIERTTIFAVEISEGLRFQERFITYQSLREHYPRQLLQYLDKTNKIIL